MRGGFTVSQCADSTVQYPALEALCPDCSRMDVGDKRTGTYLRRVLAKYGAHLPAPARSLCDDRVLQYSNSVDSNFNRIARLQPDRWFAREAYTARRTSTYNVSRLQLGKGGAIFD